MSRPRRPLAARFWEKVDVKGPDDCWEWTSQARAGIGYGTIHGPGGRSGKTKRSSHVAWFLTHGQWPNGIVMHSCDNPACCNPKHLQLGTAIDNINDKVRKRRHTFGESVHTSVLLETQVRRVFDFVNDGWTNRQIATHFGVSRSTISHIKTGRNWKHVYAEMKSDDRH